MRILIVEDEQGMAQGLRGLLEKQGYAADLAPDGVSGLDTVTGLYDFLAGLSCRGWTGGVRSALLKRH